MEFKAASVDWMDSIAVLACDRDYSTNKIAFVAKPIEFMMTKHEPDGYVKEPTFKLSSQQAISLMNALWQAGVRPSDHKSVDGEVRRLEAHLADMQKLVFKT